MLQFGIFLHSLVVGFMIFFMVVVSPTRCPARGGMSAMGGRGKLCAAAVAGMISSRALLLRSRCLEEDTQSVLGAFLRRKRVSGSFVPPKFSPGRRSAAFWAPSSAGPARKMQF